MSSYDFAANYRRLTAEKLITLVKESHTLVAGAIPALRNELLHRGMTEEVKLLDASLAKGKQKPLTEFSKTELQRHVAERLAGGQSLGDLKNYLRENGVSTYDIVVDDEDEVTTIGNDLTNGKVRPEIEIVKAPPVSEHIGYEGRVITRKEINVYSDTSLVHVRRKEPANKMIAFAREIIRDGRELLMIKEPNGENSFIENMESDVMLCMQCQTGEHPIDFLLIAREDYEKHLFSTSTERTELTPREAQDIFSNVSLQGNFLYATTINHSIKKRSSTIVASTVTFDSGAVDKVKICRLERDSIFYLAPLSYRNATDIRLPDGREGLLLEDSVGFKPITSSLETS